MKLGWFDSHCSGNKPPSSPPSLSLFSERSKIRPERAALIKPIA